MKRQSGHALLIGIIVIVVIGILGALGWVFWQNLAKNSDDKKSDIASIATYDECMDAADGKSVILETYPEKCVTSDGRTFTNEAASAEKTTYCTKAEKLCFDLPVGWTVEQVARENNDNPAYTDRLSVVSPQASLYLHLMTGIDGLGGTCESNNTPYKVVSSQPSRLTGFEKTDYPTTVANVAQVVSKNLNNYQSNMYLSVDEDVAKAGDYTDDCNLMFSTVMTGKNSRPYAGMDDIDEASKDNAGAFVFIASPTPFESSIGAMGPEFATTAEAEALFQTEDYKQAAAILASVRYQN